jgi:hypothetical protein
MDITTAATDTTEAMDITAETATTVETDIAADTTAETTVGMVVDMAADTTAHLPHVPLTVVDTVAM